jgi:hypothetical protein
MTEERILNAIEAEELKPSQPSLAEFYRARVNGVEVGKGPRLPYLQSAAGPTECNFQ